MTDSVNTDYVAGSCNIGSSEIHRRYQVAITGGVLFLILSTVLIASGQSATTKLIAFAPAMLASVGYIQARNRFCFAYGLMGVFNFDLAGDVKKIKDPVALKADRAKALEIILKSALLASVLTAAVLLL
jgi:Flp pilus assembly protein protease CpaA